MSDDDTADEMTQTQPRAEQSDATAQSDDQTDDTPTADRVRRGLDYLLLAGLALFALVAAVGFYTSTQGAIRTWVSPDFRPVVSAAFNLVVLLVVSAGLVRQVRRLG